MELDLLSLKRRPTKSKAQPEANKIMTRYDIVEKMRHPGEGMSFWTATSLPDSDALEIADYVMKTFK